MIIASWALLSCLNYGVMMHRAINSEGADIDIMEVCVQHGFSGEIFDPIRVKEIVIAPIKAVKNSLIYE